MLTKEEILDLLAYVLSGGDMTNATFKQLRLVVEVALQADGQWIGRGAWRSQGTLDFE